MGLAKCSNITGRPFFTCFMRHRGVNLVLAFASLWMVSTFIACLDTILCRTPHGMGMYVVGLSNSCILCECLLTLCVSSCRSTFFCPTTGQLCVFGSMMLTRWIAGTVPEVLFLVCRQCKRGVFFNTRLAVGFPVFIIGGAFVMHGTMRIGVSSITLCCCNLTFCSCS
jgi:hypothetical protein